MPTRCHGRFAKTLVEGKTVPEVAVGWLTFLFLLTEGGERFHTQKLGVD